MQKIHSLILRNINTYFILLSFLFIVILNYKYQIWYHNAFGLIDEWLYFGTVEYFDYIRTHFYDTYYFRRWTLHLYNLFFQNLFGSFWGKFVSKNILLLFIIFYTCKLIFIISNKSIVLPILIIIKIFYLNVYFLGIVGVSYVQSESFLLFVIFLYIILTHNYNNFKLHFLTVISALSIITYQGNIKFIIPCLLLFLINKDVQFKINKKNIKNIFNFLIWTFLLIITFDFIVETILRVNWENLITYTIQYDLENRAPYITGYQTFYQDMFKRIYKVTYISGILLSIIILIIYKFFENNYLKKLV